MTYRKPELLIPASSLEVLRTAVMFGADAVYIGGEAFGLRAKAKNFSSEEMAEGVAFAHAHGVKVYVTANILAHNYDLDGARKYGFLPAVSFVGRTLRRDDSKHFTVARESHGVRVARDEAGSSLPPLPSPLHRCERPLLHLHSLVADPPQGSVAGRSRGGAARLPRLRALPHPPHAARPAERLRGRTGAERV